MSKDPETVEAQLQEEEEEERQLHQEREEEEELEQRQKPTSQEEEEDDDDDDEKSKRSEELGFVTPSSSDQKIPAKETCPPAPRKQRRDKILQTRKRRLSEDLRFFEDTDFGREEVDSFFLSFRRRPQNGVVKRRRCRSA